METARLLNPLAAQPGVGRHHPLLESIDRLDHRRVRAHLSNFIGIWKFCPPVPLLEQEFCRAPRFANPVKFYGLRSDTPVDLLPLAPNREKREPLRSAGNDKVKANRPPLPHRDEF